jgi:hypothetical protein
MNKAFSKIVICIFLICNFNCNKHIALPEVTTLGVTASEWWNGVNAAQYVYKGEGKIISDGGGDLISKGFCYSSTDESPEMMSGSVSTLNIENNGSYTTRLSLETGQIKYFIRAFAKNKAGISYGGTVAYTTYCGIDADVEIWYKQPPYAFFPQNGAKGLPLSFELIWINSYGSLFDLYLDTLPKASMKIASDVKSTHYQIDNLEPSKTYYWKIIKHWTPCEDIIGPIFYFTTAP